MKKARLLVVLLSLTALTSCNKSTTPVDPPVDDDPLEVPNIALTVYSSENNTIKINNPLEGETFSYSYEGDNIRIEGDKIIALRGDTHTTVNVTSSSSRSGSFIVTVRNRPYTSTHSSAENSEGWFNDININKVNFANSDFANGMDISSLKQLYDNDQKFYNKEGKETSLLYLLKDAGVNWIRLRLWNDPKDTYTVGGESKTYLYGGGNCDKEHIVWIAHEAKAAGLKVLLDFHYSDYYTDPTHQIVPKAWVNISNSDDMANAISTYTTETLNYFKENNATPDAVAIGNETTTGMLLHNPGAVTTDDSVEEPLYTTGRKERNNGTEAKYEASGSNTNLIKYINSAATAVKSFDSNILTMIHYARNFTATNQIVTYFNFFKNLPIDIFGVSAYSYYHFKDDDGGMTLLRNSLKTISQAFPNKKIAIAETSYGFTYEVDNWANNQFHYSSSHTFPSSAYSVNIQGQAQIIRDTTEAIATLSNGFGCFYWESAWTPTKFSGWAARTSKASWANQALFSYNGKALGSLEVYHKMLGN